MSIWNDALFLWDPNTSGSQSRDLVTGSLSASYRTEGSTTTQDGYPGRSYSGTVGSLFGCPLIDLAGVEVTMVVAASIPVSTTLYALNLSSGASSNQWLWMRLADSSTMEFSYRLDGSAAGNDYIQADPSDVSDTNIHVYAIRKSDQGAGSVLIESFVDSSTAAASDTGTPTKLEEMQWITVGRDEGNSLSSTGGSVFAAAMWPRALSNAELGGVISSPYAYLGGELFTNARLASSLVRTRQKVF